MRHLFASISTFAVVAVLFAASPVAANDLIQNNAFAPPLGSTDQRCEFGMLDDLFAWKTLGRVARFDGDKVALSHVRMYELEYSIHDMSCDGLVHTPYAPDNSFKYGVGLVAAKEFPHRVSSAAIQQLIDRIDPGVDYTVEVEVASVSDGPGRVRVFGIKGHSDLILSEPYGIDAFDERYANYPPDFAVPAEGFYGEDNVVELASFDLVESEEAQNFTSQYTFSQEEADSIRIVVVGLEGVEETGSAGVTTVITKMAIRSCALSYGASSPPSLLSLASLLLLGLVMRRFSRRRGR